MVYFAHGVGDFYLSKAACQDLGVISPQFPEPSSFPGALGVKAEMSTSVPAPAGMSTSVPAPATCAVPAPAAAMPCSPASAVCSSSSTSAPAAAMPCPPASAVCSSSSSAPASVQQSQVKDVKVDDKRRKLASRGCLKRTLPPEAPEFLLFPCVPENVTKIEHWLKERYASLSFNNCPHQPLPLMSGLPPLRIILKDGAETKAVHRPATIPAHWMDKVREGLEQDIALGVLERVPHNTPRTWCSRMHVVGKKTGEPRRVVDLREVNRSTVRQTHYMEPPFLQAMGIKPGTWRFTSDAWNGYHSVPIDERDRHITTFITPWGRMRYRVAPQGWLSSGDGLS